MREHAEAVIRGGFGAQDDWTQSNGPATAALSEGKLCRSEIAFGPDQHQNAANDIFVSVSESMGAVLRNILREERFRWADRPGFQP